MEKDQIYKELNDLIDSGDENKIKDFLMEHINDFPEEIKNKIVFSFFEESLNNESIVSNNIKDLQEELIKQKGEIEKDIRKTEDIEKIIDIKENL